MPLPANAQVRAAQSFVVSMRNAYEFLLQQDASLGTPELRELILKPYALLYAHGESQVFLLSLRHERQLLVEVG